MSVDYPTLDPRAVSLAKEITSLLSPECRTDGRESPSETGCALTWVHRRLFCHVDTPDDNSTSSTPLEIMIHWLTKTGSASWDDHSEFPKNAKEAATRLMELWGTQK